MTVSGICESFVAHTLIDNSYLTLKCTKEANHDGDHQAVYYWPTDITDWAIPGLTGQEADDFHAAIEGNT